MDERTDPAANRPLGADELPTRPAVPTPGVGAQPLLGVPGGTVEPVLTPVSQTEQSPEQLHAEIIRTRTEMGSTVNTIENRLSPSNITERAKQQAQSALLEKAQPAIHAVNSAMEQVTPLAMQVRDQAQERFEQAREQVMRLQERDDVQQFTGLLRERAPLILGGLTALGGAFWLLGKLRGGADDADYDEWVEYLEDDDLEELPARRGDDTRMEITLPAEVFITGNGRRTERLDRKEGK